ncbi:BglG family transcription antiterminator [Pseudoleptotrichia goodfellowii]|uniref:PTS modulated transcriptional regulator MtlR family n=1 Tax=Pseudoleptotrichia goodfellowii TaxID=157692 RepID=A0A510J8G8_9FUSO|nr:PTS sugar transporter subunit IIA [Pseudoleptotrichia goodfellowii]BBM35599.1 PTS modulated transcriptional regulator MtlR family [Pseudoleptotrichia goodfellowii]
MLNYKEIEILNSLIKGEKCSFRAISEKYGISDRAARYYIDNIDYILKILGYKITEKDRNIIFLETDQDFSKIFEILKKAQKLSVDDRVNILKLILFFDEKGLNITKISEELQISRTTIKKDMKLLSEELGKDGIKLNYKNNIGYKPEGNNGEILIKQIELIEEILELSKGKDDFKIVKTQILNYFYKYIKEENIENTKEFIVEVEKVMELNINGESYNKIFSYMLILLNFDGKYGNSQDSVSKKFLAHTDEYEKIKEILENILKATVKQEMLIEMTDLITGITINSFENNSFEDWINEELIIKKMISKVSKIVKTDLTRDEILYNGLLYHIKPAMYRIKNNIQITNSVFKELILAKDPVLNVVNEGIKEIEELFGVKFPEDEIALIGFHIKASIERNTSEKTKKVILICGLGYGSSKVLEQSLKENYDLDIVDVLPYYLIEDTLPNYKNIDLILSTVDLKHKYGDVPVVKINPLLKEDDFVKLSKYGIKKGNRKISMKKLMKIIKNNTTMENSDKLIEELKQELENSIVDDLSDAGTILREILNKENVRFAEKVQDWEEAITKSGNILVENKVVKSGYVEEMIKLVKKHGAYIVIEEGIAIPHAGISENVLKTGVSLLIVKEKVFFPSGRGANIFLSFATINKNDHLNILNDLFELITKYNFIEEISKISKYEELEKYFRKEFVC